MIDSPVCIRVQSVYIEAQSSPDNERYVFSLYRNHTRSGASAVQLLRRYWLIANGDGRETEVRARMVRVQPLIAPGEEYRTPAVQYIETPLGHHAGSLQNDR
ncbi:ApaG domain [Escherichia coli]